MPLPSSDTVAMPVPTDLRFAVAFRDIAQATNERTMIACIAPPGVVFGHTATVEKSEVAGFVCTAFRCR